MLKRFLFLFLFISSQIIAQETFNKFKFYGILRSDFFYNSRQNVDAIDGVFYILPKPIEYNSINEDINAIPQSEMLSITSRLGVNISGDDILGAKSSARIEADFAGFGSSYFVLRIRHAFAKLEWQNSELLVGQTWHPMFGTVTPSIMSFNAGVPFQPLNWSPQIRYNMKICPTFSMSVAAVYQMQYLSQGPMGMSSSYLKNALLPNLFLGFENKTSLWTTGIGLDFKTIKPAAQTLSSVSAVFYSQYIQSDFQLKAKVVFGQNLSDHVMIGGYGISGYNADSTVVSSYTNFNNLSSWLNVIYGKKIQLGLFLGLSQNLGTNHELISILGRYTAYGFGVFTDRQILLDRLYSITPHVSYNLKNMKFGIEYDLSTATYGIINKKGRVESPYTVNNHRIIASLRNCQ